MKVLLLLILICFRIFVCGQDKKETFAYFELIKSIASSERFGNNLVYRLDTLKSKFIPSRSGVNDYFNRDIDFGFKHRRINVNLNIAVYQIDLLCQKDTIFLISITTIYPNINYKNFNKSIIDHFLKNRNKLYSSSKTAMQLIREISFEEEYAFYCGDGDPKTQKGKYIERLVEEENSDELLDMLKSFNYETQAYGVSGYNMLAKKDYEIPVDVKKLIDHIRKRNAELVICSGCLSGLVEKIYSKD